MMNYLTLAIALLLPTAVFSQTSDDEPTPSPASDDCSVCGERMEVGNPEAMFQYSSFPESSCEDYEDAGYQGAFTREQCEEIISLISEVCQCVAYPPYCRVCGDGKRVGNPDATWYPVGTETCGEIETKGANGELSSKTCDDVQSFVLGSDDPCGCVDIPTPPPIYIPTPQPTSPTPRPIDPPTKPSTPSPTKAPVTASPTAAPVAPADTPTFSPTSLPTKAPVPATDSPTYPPTYSPTCVCSPLSYTFTINLSQNCDTDDFQDGPGIGNTICQILPSINEDEIDFDTLKVFDVQFLEIDTSGNLTPINQETYTDVSLSSGDIISFNSASVELNPDEPLSSQLNYVPGGVLMTLRAKSEGSSTIWQNRVSWTYTNSCESWPTSVGDAIGWITLSDQTEASHAFCPVAPTPSPTKAPVTASPTAAPVAPADTPTFSPTKAPVAATDSPTTSPTKSPTLSPVPDPTKEPTTKTPTVHPSKYYNSSWGWGGGGGKPTKKPTRRPSPSSNTWGSSSWGESGGKGPTDWVWNGWEWNEAANDAWTGDGWQWNWNGN